MLNIGKHSPNGRTKFTLPDDALAWSYAILAKRGAGKTFTARVMAEEWFKAGVPFFVMDPTGAWWGLRSSADGNEVGLPVVVFGGEHGDMPLEREAGRQIADLFLETGVSIVLDLSALGSHAAERQFAYDFLERVYRQNRDLVHGFIDEADLFAPQKPQPGDQKLLGVMENIVRRGRIKGLVITLISQRSAVLNKDVLTQVDVLVLLRMLSPQDRKAVLQWVEAHASLAERGDVFESLAILQNGESWWWIPEADILERVQVRLADTYDSSPTPSRAGRRAEPKTRADVDLAAFEAQMAATIERAKAEDPRWLQQRVRELELELQKRPSEQVEVEVEVIREVPTLVDADRNLLYEFMEDVSGVASALEETLRPIRDGLARLNSQPPARPSPTTRAPQPQTPVPTTPRAAHRAEPADDAKLPAAQRKVLTVLAQHGSSSKHKVALLAGYAHSGGGFNNALSALRTAGYLNRGEPMEATQDGLDALGTWEPLPSGPELVQHWLASLSKAERLILETLVSHWPNPLSKDELGRLTGYEPAGGGFNNALSKLRTLGLINRGSEIMVDETLGSLGGAR